MEQVGGFSWTPIPGHNGTAATITAYASGLLTVGGLGGLITSDAVEHVLTLGGAAQPGNIGTFQIVEMIDANTVVVADVNGVFPDANSGSISWQTSTINLFFPPTIGVPDDGDAWDAAEFASGYEGLAMRTAALAYQALIEDDATFLTSGTWIAPAGCTWVEVDGSGGGGGGEAGCIGETGGNSRTAQGGGGAAAQRQSARIAVVPGTEYVVTVGDGGAGGVHNGGAGADGSPTTFGTASPWSVSMRGGRGAGWGVDNVVAGSNATIVVPVTVSSNTIAIAPGAYGAADLLAQRPGPWVDPADSIMFFYPNTLGATFLDNDRFGVRVPGAGGAAIVAANIDTTFTNFPGGASQHGMASAGWFGKDSLALYGSFIGGAPGNMGTDATSPLHLGGCAGGGGGGGPFGPGANGGNGGNGNGSGSGAGHVGTAGADAAANTGAGGGGGGCGAGGSGGPGHGGDGGNGGSGRLHLKFLRFATVTGPITTP